MRSRRVLILAGALLALAAAAPQPRAQTGARALFLFEDAGRFGYVDRGGKVVVPPSYRSARRFAGGLAAVLVDDAWGFIDATGRRVIPAAFEGVDDFSDGIAAVRKQGRVVFIDQTGTVKFEDARIGLALPAAEGLIAVKVGRAWGFVDYQGRFVVEPAYEVAFAFSEGLAAVRLNLEWGYIDRTGAMVIKPRFAGAGPFVNGQAPVRLVDAWGYVDRTGAFAITPRYAGAERLSEGLGRVVEWDRDRLPAYGFVDASGKVVVPLEFRDAGDFHDGRALVRVGKLFGYIDARGKMVIPPSYFWAADFAGGLAEVRLGTPEAPTPAYIDPSGTVVWKLSAPGPAR